ncbi:putative reverse transcriptase domain-containing protein [Tanacetum coccineum]|uniref:Reverse transcriptase domain-containing protein n=1 Tax=Tanacetum coccineum TaxID=301880 RepID=A0ABQ4ZM41_9ASTR
MKVNDHQNNYSHQQQPLQEQNVAKSNNRDRQKEAVWGFFAQRALDAIFHHNARAPRSPQLQHWEMVGFECGAPGHFKRDCPKLKNKDGGNGNAQGWVYAVGNAEKRGNASGNPDSNVVTVIIIFKASRVQAKGSSLCGADIYQERETIVRKQIKDVPSYETFTEVFPEDLPGLPPARPVGISERSDPWPRPNSDHRIDWHHPNEELSEQLQELSRQRIHKA